MEVPQSTDNPQPALTKKQVTPLNLKIRRQRAELTVNWADGTESAYPLTFLRKQCPCAACRSEREKPKELLPVLSVAPASHLTVTSADLVGNYALHILWSDGHDTGIYDFRYLRSIDPAN